MYARCSPNPVIFNPWAPSPLLPPLPLLSWRKPEMVGRFSLMIDTPCSPTHCAAIGTHTQGNSERGVAEEKRLNSWYATCFSASTNPSNLSQQARSHYLSLTSRVSYMAHTHSSDLSRLLIYYLGPGLWALRGRSTRGTQWDRESGWQDSSPRPQQPNTWKGGWTRALHKSAD